MKYKIVNYIFIPFVSLSMMVGCGDSSSVSGTNSSLVEETEELAVYIAPEDFSTQGKPSTSMLSQTPYFNSSSKIVKEDAQRDSLDEKWKIYDNKPVGANMHIVYDEMKESRVVEFNGNGIQNGYVLGYWTKLGSWQNKTHTIIQWSMNYSENYYIYVRISTSKGYRYLYYTPSDGNYGIAKKYDRPHYIHHGLGMDSMDGTWREVTRDIEADLKDFEPDNTFVSVDGFFVRGSGKIDDVALFTNTPTTVTPTVDNAIKEWVKSYKYPATPDSTLEYTLVKSTISENKQRAVIEVEGPASGLRYLEILDLSDLNNIQSLASIHEYYTNFTREIIFKDNDSILLVRNRQIMIYDFHDGALLSLFEKGHPLLGNEYFVVKENYIILSYLSDSEGTLANNMLIKYDFTDRANPVTSILAEGMGYTYKTDDAKTTIIVQDAEGNPLNAIKIETLNPINNAINAWLHDNPPNEEKRDYTVIKSIISPNQSRAVVYIDKAFIPNSVYLHLLDISDLSNIRDLGVCLHEYRADQTQHEIIKENDYILLIRNREIMLYDFHNGKLLGSFESLHVLSGNTYIVINEDYVIFSYASIDNYLNTVLAKYDFTDRAHPRTTILYEGQGSYELSSDKSKILIKNNNELLTEIPLN